MNMQPSRIKVLKFISNFFIAGTERQFMNLGRSLDPSRFELHFACLKRRGDFLKEVEALRIPLAEYNFKSFYHPKVLKEQLRFAAYIKRNLIHIVHTYGFSPNVFAIPAAWLAGAPVIVASIRDTGGYQTPTQSRVQISVTSIQRDQVLFGSGGACGRTFSRGTLSHRRRGTDRGKRPGRGAL